MQAQPNVTVGNAHAQDLVIAKQGWFAVGGQTTRHVGIYDNSKFVGWAEQDETGQSHRENHAMVEYQIPKDAHALPLVYVHGYGGSGICWQATPDGRDGFATLMLRHGWSSYVMDLPGRGRAGRVKNEKTVRPVADEMFWFDIWRMGVWPKWNEGVQMRTDSASLSQFFRQMTPDLSDGMQDVPALTAIGKRIGSHILVTHSAGGFSGWLSAIANQEVCGVAAYEPGGFVFPEGEVPEKIDGLTGGAAGFPVPMNQWKRLTEIPIVLYFGDYIPEKPSRDLGDENWRVRLQMARQFVEAINRHGGRATLVELPKQGIQGNTHFLMQDLNNYVLARLLDEWLVKNFNAANAQNSTSLTRRQQSLSVIAALEAKGDILHLKKVLNASLDDALTVAEAKEALSQLYAYTGFPRSLNALDALQRVIAERGKAGKSTNVGKDDEMAVPEGFDALLEGTRVQSAVVGGREYSYAFAPRTDYYLKAHLFGDIFAGKVLSHSDREIVTVSALSALDGCEAQLHGHCSGALNMGVSETALRAIPQVLAENVGETEAWRLRRAIAAIKGEMCTEGRPVDFSVWPKGELNTAFAKYFSGNSYLAPLATRHGGPVNVTFEPGCRNNWHIHHGAVQVLICVAGRGWYQEEGKAPIEMKPGTVVAVPAEVKHWHGAAKDSWFQHIAYHTQEQESNSTEWLETVSDEIYDKLP